jgi:hypothetical protein
MEVNPGIGRMQSPRLHSRKETTRFPYIVARDERTSPESYLGLQLLPDAARDPDSYPRSVKKIGYMVWTAAGLYIILSCIWDQFSEMLDYLLPAVSSAVDGGYWWVQAPVLAFLGALICGVVATGYHALSRMLD